MDNAEAQFTTALRVSLWQILVFCLSSNTLTNIISSPLFSSTSIICCCLKHVRSVVFQLTTHQELWTYIVTNLASVYIREGNRHQEVSLVITGHVLKMQQNKAVNQFWRKWLVLIIWWLWYIFCRPWSLWLQCQQFITVMLSSICLWATE